MGKRKRSGSFSKYDDCSKKSDDGDSQEEMDVETLVVHKGNIVNGIRYSARVQEKQEKLRREASPSKQTVADSTSAPVIVLPCQSTTKTTIGEDAADMIPLETTFIAQSISISGEKKKKRTWELWSQEDKQLFFEALNEFGKDFDAIQNYLASKLKPRSKSLCSQTVPKNKDQVRHFYYRTWNKISKYLTFPKDMKKAFQELYGLINYGELRKKQRVLNSKTAVKLSELVERGTTTIKVRGKTFRIKTPVCRALKRLNQLDDVDHIRVPCKLCVELVPHDGNTWSSIQRVSHNPRVKVYVPLQRTLASLIVYFEERWKTYQSRLKEEFSLSMFGKPRTRLRLFPVDNRDLSVPIFKFSETTSATKISLSAYVQNCLHPEPKQDAVLISKNIKRKSKPTEDASSTQGHGSASHRDLDYLAVETDASDVDGCEAAPENQFRITLRRDKPQSGVNPCATRLFEPYLEHDNSNGFPDNNALWCVHEENANAATETDAAEMDYGFDENAPSPTECDENTCDEDCMDPVISDNGMLYGADLENREEKPCTCLIRNTTEVEEIGSSDKAEKQQCTCAARKTVETEDVKCRVLDSETIIRGWNAVEAGTVTLGEIYLMLGKSDKLCFEYMWDVCEEDKIREDRAHTLVDKLISVARHLKKKKSNRAKSIASVPAASSNKSFICIKCTMKMESPGSTESEPSSSTMVVTSTKESSDSPQFETPQRPHTTLQQLSDCLDENKITLHAAQDQVDADSPTMAEYRRHESTSMESNVMSSSETPELVSVSQTQDSEAEETPSGHSHGLVLTDSITSSDTISSPSTMCSKQPSVAPQTDRSVRQTGLIDISTLASSTDLDSSIRRANPNIKATIMPSAATILRSVTLNSCLTEAQKTTLGSCHSSTISPVATTTTVLVSEPAVFTGLTTEASPFVTIQQCTATSVSHDSPLAQNTQDTKFRRPADVPILMKPSNDDRSTNEDGSAKLSVPKPFLDLPKGNRRIGRRPAWKQRVIIPRMLPLLPKPDESMIKSATMTTLIAIPPVVATGLSVVPVSTENFTPISTLTPTGHETNLCATSLTGPTVTLASSVTVAVSSLLAHSSNDKIITASSLMSGSAIPTSGATAPIMSGSIDGQIAGTDKDLLQKTAETCLPSSSRTGPFEETLDNLSLSSFMDISIPESTRFIASDLRLEELECSNSSMSLSGMLDDSSRKNSRDPSLLDTPKKQSKNGDSQVDIPSPPRLTPLTSLETSWPAMNEGSDLFMGGLFGGHEGLRGTATESLSEGDLNFQTVMGESSLDFETKLGEFSTNITDRNKN